ncbi:hypothetical protein GCM10022240_24180 [Microbacterium kribbense]|uniref:Uncharacterized protein n=1 Tax=Microbacterium kribbense TaxID=433645 RepID=A0ABP7GPU1_9MICO
MSVESLSAPPEPSRVKALLARGSSVEKVIYASIGRAVFRRPFGPDGLRVRNGLDWDVHVTWDDVESVAVHRRSYEPKSPRLFDEDGSRILRHTVGPETKGPERPGEPHHGPTTARHVSELCSPRCR